MATTDLTSAQPVAQTRSQSRRLTSKRIKRVGLYLFLTVGCLVTLLPFVWMILGSFKTSGEIIRIPPSFWPENPTFDNYRTILSDPKLPLARFYANSLFVSISVVALVLFTSSLAGFIFAKYEFFGKNILFGFILATLMIPFQVLMIPSYLILVRLGLIDSLWGLVIPGATSAFGIFLMKQFIQGLPNELLDAAAHRWFQRVGHLLAHYRAPGRSGPRHTWHSHVHGYVEQLPVASHCDHVSREAHASHRTDLVQLHARHPL